MDFGQALTYIFEDKEWLSKMVILALLMVASMIPVLGLIPLAICLGFLAQLTNNVRNGHPRPLPKWDDYSEKLSIGGNILVAMLVYNLPVLLLGLIISFFVQVIGGGFLGTTVNLMMLCCALPLTLVYTYITWSLLAAGIAEYIETGKRQALYRPIHQWDLIRTHGSLTMRWLIAATFVNLIVGVTMIIPCLGIPVMLTLLLPVQGHLLGQYARQLAIKAKI